MKKLLEQYYRLFIHSEAQKYSIAYLKGSEADYPHQSDYLTESDLISSIKGDKSLGLILCQDKTGLSKCGAIDLDIPRDAKDLSEALTIAQNIVKSASELGVNLYIEFSGNRGFHIWVFVEKAITHEPIKKALRAIALRANFNPEEIYPKDLNSNIKLPCTTHLKTNLRCGFISSNFDVNNPEIDLSSQGDLMAKFEVTALDKIINLSSELESLEKTRNSNNSRSEDKSFNEARSKEEIESKLNSLGDHPSCIKFLMSNGAPLEVDYNQANLTLIRYCLTRGFNLEDSLPLAEAMAKNTSEAHSTSKDYQGKIKNFKSAFNSCDRNSDNYLFGCSFILSGINKGEAHTRGCIGTKCKVHFNYSEDRADTDNSENAKFTLVNSLIYASMVNILDNGKELVKSQILRESEALAENYLINGNNQNISDSIRLIESEVIGYFLQNPETLIDYCDIFPNGFRATISNNQTISDYIDYCLSLKLPSPETLEEYLEDIRVNGVKVTASLRFLDYGFKVKSETTEPIETISDLISDSEKLLNLSINDNNLCPTSEKLEGLITQLLSEDRLAIPTFSEDLNYLLNGGFSRGRFYVISAGPANGKSTICLQCADYASSQGFKVGYFSFEMSLEQIFITQISRLGEINSGYLDNKIYLNNDSLKLKVLDTIESYYDDYSENIYVIECDDSFTPNKILSVIKKLKLDLVFIDYLQLMNSGDKDIDNNGNETIRVSKIATELKRLARKSDTPIIAISDVSKTAFENAKNSKKGLDMSALRDSFKIAHSADCVMLLHSQDFELKNDTDTIKTQLDLIRSNWEKKDLLVARLIQNIENNTTMNKATADIYSRLYIDKNRTGKLGDILFKYSKAIHKFEPLNYLQQSMKKQEY